MEWTYCHQIRFEDASTKISVLHREKRGMRWEAWIAGFEALHLLVQMTSARACSVGRRVITKTSLILDRGD